MVAKCPKCESNINHMNAANHDIWAGGRPRWKGVFFTCPKCQTILGAGVDDVAVKADIVNEVVAKLRGG